MASFNHAVVLGNLGRDPEVRYTQSGQAVASFSVATTDRWTDKDGGQKEKTEWHRITVWGKQAENCGQYLKKGSQCLVEGKLQTREWLDKEGKKNYTTEIVAKQVQFIGAKQSSSEPEKQSPPGDDELPF